MPALSSALETSAFAALVARNVTDNSSAAGEALQVVCAWPLSGQYGPGTRVLYYVLIAACVLARKAEWIKNACLAAALLLPAVAAVHGIVLAALHRDDAVDMDIFGAFQLCAIGILAAPVTVRLSRTYFYTPGRNTIFLWAGLILAGLLSLTVEFYRVQTTGCTHDDFGHPVSLDISKYLYANNTCGLTFCIDPGGPVSPMRGGSASNIYVIPAPDRLTFGTATLLAAACCVYAILWLVSMLDKILEINFGLQRDVDELIDAPIEGTNGATRGKMRSVNNMVRFFLSVAVVPVFGGAGLALLIVGERNFFSPQVIYENEPLASIGQWAPILGTGLAAVGSLYLLLASDVEAVKGEGDPNAEHHCKCSHHHLEQQPSQAANQSPSSQASHSTDSSIVETPGITGSPAVQRATTISSPAMASPDVISSVRPSFSNDLAPAISRHRSAPASTQVKRPERTGDSGSRRKVAKMFIAVGNSLGTAAHDWFDDSEFRRGRAVDFPEIPGEHLRNRDLAHIRELYNPRRDADGNATELPRSRASSFVGSVASGQMGTEGGFRSASPQPLHSHSLPQSSAVVRQRASTMPAGRASFELHAVDPNRGRRRARRDTLEVPSPMHHNPMRSILSPSISSTTAANAGRGSLPERDSASSDEDSFAISTTPPRPPIIATSSEPVPPPTSH